MSVRSSSLQTTGERVSICRRSVLQALTLAFRNALYACQSVFAIPALFCFWAKWPQEEKGRHNVDCGAGVDSGEGDTVSAGDGDMQMARIGDVLFALQLRIHSAGCIPRAGARSCAKIRPLIRYFYEKAVFNGDC